MLLVQLAQRVLQAAPRTLEVAAVDLEHGIKLAALDGIVQPGPPGLEFLDVGGEKILAVTVQCVEVAVEHQRRGAVVHGRAAVVGALEQRSHQPADLAVPIRGREHLVRRHRLGRGGAGHQERQQ